MKKIYYSVQWSGSAPLSHPAFKRGFVVPGSNPPVYQMDFPVDNPSLRRAKAVQHMWATDVVRHLASWGIRGQLCAHPA